MPAGLDLIGQKLGRLLVVERAESRGDGRRWRCRCDCGEERITGTCSLRSGNTTSCGCSRRGKTGKPKHGHASRRTQAYLAWKRMRRRCADPRKIGYGAAGLSVDPRWDDFAVFLADMGEPPPGHTLDRIDNGKGYSRHNCRWATHRQQTRNRRCAILASFRGRTMALQDIADELGFTYSTVVHRYHRGQPLDGPLRFRTLGRITPR